MAEELIELTFGRNIYLVGMMGSGKSTIGKVLSKVLQRNFFDTDHLIEDHCGFPVSTIYQVRGEDIFRDFESITLKVWLAGHPELLAQRVILDKYNSRPVLSLDKTHQDLEMDSFARVKEQLADIYKKRKKLYEKACIRVSIHDSENPLLGSSISTIIHRILEGLLKFVKNQKLYDDII